MVGSHTDIHIICLSPFAKALSCASDNCKLHKFQSSITYSTSHLYRLPIPPKVPVAVQHGTRLTGLTPPGFTCASDVIPLGLDKGFELLLLTLHAAHVCVETFQVWFIVVNTSWSRLRDAASTQFGMLSHSLPLASLVLSLPHFKTCLKFYQRALLAPALEFFSLSEKGASHQMLIDQVLNIPSHSQKAQIFPVTSDLKSCVGLKVLNCGSFCYSFFLPERPRKTLPVVLILQPVMQGDDSLLNCLLF